MRVCEFESLQYSKKQKKKERKKKRRSSIFHTFETQYLFEFCTYSFVATWTVKHVVLSRPFEFDGINSISTVEEIAQEIKSRRFWLNIQVKFSNIMKCTAIFVFSYCQIRRNRWMPDHQELHASCGDRTIYMICMLVG